MFRSQIEKLYLFARAQGWVVIYLLFGLIVHFLFLETKNTQLDHLTKGYYLSLIGVFCSQYFFAERPNSKLYEMLLTIIALVASTLLVYVYPFDSTQFRHLFLSGLLIYLLSPQLIRKTESLAFPWIVSQLHALGTALAITLVTFGFGAMLAFMLKQLFNYDVPDIILRLGLSSLCTLGVFVYAFSIPSKQSLLALRYKLPSLVEKSLLYLFTPITLVYITVLLIYGLKILFAWKLPKGLVTIPISIAYTTFVLIRSYFQSQNQETILWKKAAWIQWSFLPLMTLMGIGISRRVIDYGFTPARFYLVALFMMALISFLLWIAYQAFELRKLLKVVIIFLMASTWGPLNPEAVSLQSQGSLFISIIRPYVTSPERSLSLNIEKWKKPEQSRAYEALLFIHKYQMQDELIKLLIDKQLLSSTASAKEVRIELDRLEKNLSAKLDRSYFYSSRTFEDSGDEEKGASPKRPECLTFNSSDPSTWQMLDVSGFDFVVPIFQYSQPYFDFNYSIPNSSEKLRANPKENKLYLGNNLGDPSTLVVDLVAVIRDHIESQASTTPLVKTIENSYYVLKLQIYSAAIKCENMSIKGHALIKRKPH